MKKRHTFVCWNCEETYTLMREFIAGQVLNVACPFCGEEGLVDLSPYHEEHLVTFRDVSAPESRHSDLELPDVLPTMSKPKEA